MPVNRGKSCGGSDDPKHYGRLRMFRLRRAGDGKGPAMLGDIDAATVVVTSSVPRSFRPSRRKV
jgi:hypothetical protein